MVSKKIVPGTRVEIVGGKYKGKRGILRYETEMRYLVLIDGMDIGRYLSKENVIDADLSSKEEKSNKLQDIGSDSNEKAILKLETEIRETMELSKVILMKLDKCAEDLKELKLSK
jgi:ribosomal protein L24